MQRSRYQRLAALTLTGALGISVPGVMLASSANASSSHSSTSTSSWTAWHATWMTYINGLKSINATFKTAVQGARSTYVAARASATTKADRRAALATLDAALVAAFNARVTAITAAGDPPPPPAGYNGTAYVMGVQAANVAFRTAVENAQSAFAKALAAATNAAGRKAARLARIAAVQNAAVARSTALTALGPPPAHAGQPAA